MPFLIAFLNLGSRGHTGAVFFAGKTSGPEKRIQKKTRYWFEKDSAPQPYQMHIHALRDADISVEEELVVQRAGRHGPTRHP